MVVERLELRSRIKIEDELMTLELWRMEDNTLTVLIEKDNMTLTANANTTIELEDFINKAYLFIKRVR
jgi:hypothetical protein